MTIEVESKVEVFDNQQSLGECAQLRFTRRHVQQSHLKTLS